MYVETLYGSGDQIGLIVQVVAVFPKGGSWYWRWPELMLEKGRTGRRSDLELQTTFLRQKTAASNRARELTHTSRTADEPDGGVLPAGHRHRPWLCLLHPRLE
jgi:hypothetical protein